MNQAQLTRIIVGAALALGFPIAALADLTQTTTLQTNTSLNLDTGATVAGSGGDILWNGSTIAPQRTATAAFYVSGWPIAQFGTISSILISLLPGYSQSPIAAANLMPGAYLVYTRTVLITPR
jgi:hypothetical protein